MHQFARPGSGVLERGADDFARLGQNGLEKGLHFLADRLLLAPAEQALGARRPAPDDALHRMDDDARMIEQPRIISSKAASVVGECGAGGIDVLSGFRRAKRPGAIRLARAVHPHAIAVAGQAREHGIFVDAHVVTTALGDDAATDQRLVIVRDTVSMVRPR